MNAFRYYQAKATVPDGELVGWFEEINGTIHPCTPVEGMAPIDMWTISDDILKSQITISIYGDANSRRVLPAKFDPVYRLLRLIRSMAAFKFGLVAYGLEQSHNFVYADELEISAVQTSLSRGERRNLLTEAFLGSWKPLEPADLLNLAAIAEIDPECTEEKFFKVLRDYFRQADSFLTRLTGFQYQSAHFLRTENGMEKSRLALGDECRLVREPYNRVDPNAVMVIHCTGRKMGYLRRTIAEFLAPLMDKGRLYRGKVRGFLPDDFPLDTRVHLAVERVG